MGLAVIIVIRLVKLDKLFRIETCISFSLEILWVNQSEFVMDSKQRLPMEPGWGSLKCQPMTETEGPETDSWMESSRMVGTMEATRC